MLSRWNVMAVGLAVLGSVSAHAVIRPGWERPIEKAKLMEIDSTGHEIGIGLEKTLTMNQRDEAQSPTSFTFKEEQVVMCLVAPCPQHVTKQSLFQIRSKTKIECGSTQYDASRPLFFGTKFGSLERMPRVIPSERITVVDHSTRVCDDYKPYRWEVTLKRDLGAKRFFQGNPEEVFTPQRAE